MEASFVLLKQFVDQCKANPALLHHPKLEFYREYLSSLGATLPEKPAEKPSAPKEEPMPEEHVEEPKEEEEEIEKPEFDMTGVIEADSGEPLPMGDAGSEPSDENVEKSGEERSKAMEAFSDGRVDEAVTHYTNAIQLNPNSAVLFAKRAQCLVQLKRPIAAIRDCDRAIELNADSAPAYKFRGKARRLLGEWVHAYTDFGVAQKLDYDDSVNEWMKEIEPNAKKAKEYERAVERKREEKELAERRERVKRAQEERAKAAAAAQSHEEDDEDGAGIGAFFSMLAQDPECKEALQDPTVMAAVMEIMQNPMSMTKHMNNAKVMTVVGKLKGLFGGGGMGGMEGMFGGPPGASSGGCCPGDGHGHGHDHGPSTHSHSSGAPKPPQPDLD